MTALADLEFFLRAGRASSISEASRAAGVTPAAGSAAVKRLEAQLGTKLFVRSTRSLRLTVEGAAFLQQCEQGLEIIKNARESLMAGRDAIRGCVQMSVPSDLGRNLVLGWLHQFRKRYSDVEIRLQVSDRVAGIHREQVDVALRYGEPRDSSLIALDVAPHNRRILCAATSYVKSFGAPQSPQELRQHNCLCFQLSDKNHNRWTFTRGKEQETVLVRGLVQSDDGEVIRRLAVMGEGIAYKSGLDVLDDLRRGNLVALCTDWQGEPAPLHLTCADRSQLRPVVRLLREFLVEQIAALNRN